MLANVPSPRGRGAVILLVEEDHTERKLYRLILESGGYSVVDARDGLEAWDIAQSYQGRIHVLVTDVRISRMDGYELSSRMAGLRPETKTVFISSGAAIQGQHTIPRPSLPKMLIPTVGALLSPVQVARAGA